LAVEKSTTKKFLDLLELICERKIVIANLVGRADKLLTIENYDV